MTIFTLKRLFHLSLWLKVMAQSAYVFPMKANATAVWKKTA